MRIVLKKNGRGEEVSGSAPSPAAMVEKTPSVTRHRSRLAGQGAVSAMGREEMRMDESPAGLNADLHQMHEESKLLPHR